MKTVRNLLAGVAALGLVVGGVLAGELKSGPQEGQKVPGPFHPLNVTGESAGQKACLYCKNGSNPVAMIFARENSTELTNLIKKIDTCTAKNKDAKMGSFVVFLNDSDKLEGELKEIAKKEAIKECVLSIDNPAGPQGYKVSLDADVTVVLYTQGTVKANHAFKKGELKDKDIDTVVADVAKILPKE
jgi:hypothetical protein